MNTGGLEVSRDTGVTEGAKSPGQTLGKLERTIDGLDGAIREPSPSNVFGCSLPTRGRVRAA
jgi:hypothetical protein